MRYFSPKKIHFFSDFFLCHFGAIFYKDRCCVFFLWYSSSYSTTPFLYVKTKACWKKGKYGERDPDHFFFVFAPKFAKEKGRKAPGEGPREALAKKDACSIVEFIFGCLH